MTSTIRLFLQPRMPRAGDPPLTPFWLGLWACTLSCAWLLPNHYPPWAGFHADAWIAIVLAMAMAFVILRSKVAIQWHGSALLVAVLACIPWLQYSAGLIAFAGQAWMSTAYLVGLLVALLSGQLWARASPEQLINGLFLAIGIASVLSVNLQLQTWLDLIDTGIFDLWSMGLIGGRPYANFGQPNQLATLLLWGLLACGWAYNNEKIRASIAILLACFLLTGIALSQSRTAWIGLSFLVIASWVWRRLWHSNWVPVCVTGLFLFFLACPSLLSAFSEAMQTSPDHRHFRGDQLEGGLRPLAWKLFLNAALLRPWFGYGWSEVVNAQLAVASNLPPLYETFGHAHNLFLDLILWLGLPVGIFVSVAMILQFSAYVRRVSNAKDAILVMFLGVVGIHAMLELPLHYAYFLLPTGMVIGVLNNRIGGKPVLTTPRWTLMGLWLGATLLLSMIVVDYFRIEASFQKLRFELARIGTLPQGKPPEVVVLTQLRERIGFMRFEVKQDMTPAELDWLLMVATAYPGGGVIYKVAKALALNNRPADAQQWLKKICKISAVEECDLIKRIWVQDSVENPLIAIVPWPN